MSLNFPDAPTNGQQFSGYVWSSSEGVWNRLPDAPGINLSNLGDVNVSSLSSGQSLVYNGTDWSNTPLSNNFIINGNFGIWQRGTSASFNNGYLTSDRWKTEYATAFPTGTASRQSFTPGDIVAIGYGDAEYFYRSNVTNNNGCTFHALEHLIEDVRTFAGQQVTLSFWAKSASAVSLPSRFVHQFGSGGSDVVVFATTSHSLTTSWQRFNLTINVPSVSGKTIGAGSSLRLDFLMPLSVHTVDLWGVQLEAGSTATPFKLAGGGSKGAELALCQRYYQKFEGVNGSQLCQSAYITTTAANGILHFPVQMRQVPIGSVSSQTVLSVVNNTATTAGTAVSIGFDGAALSTNSARVTVTTTARTAGHAGYIIFNNDGWIDFSAEF